MIEIEEKMEEEEQQLVRRECRTKHRDDAPPSQTPLPQTTQVPEVPAGSTKMPPTTSSIPEVAKDQLAPSTKIVDYVAIVGDFAPA